MRIVARGEANDNIELRIYEDEDSYGFKCVAYQNGQRSGWEFEESDLESAIGTMNAEIKRGIQIEWI
jgi:hypothetical protein